MPCRGYLKAIIGQDECLELLCQSYSFADVCLQSLDAVRAQDEPHLQCPEAFAQRDLPVHVVNGLARILVLQVQWLHVERAMDSTTVLHPHGGTVKVDLFERQKKKKALHKVHPNNQEVTYHKPLGRIERNRVRVVDALQPCPEFGADKCTAGICSIHVQPQVELATYLTHLLQVVKGTCSR